MREPRNLDKYSSAEGAARGLEKLAADIRAHAGVHPLVRWDIKVSFWNPAWKSDTKKSRAPTQETP